MSKNQSLDRTTLQQAAIDPKGVQDFIGACLQNGSELHQLMIIRDGKVAFEGCSDPYQPQDRRHVYSISKSWTATAVGLAIAEGRLSLSDQVVSFFPDDLSPDPGKNLMDMQVRDLLVMGCGQDTEPAIRRTDHWVHAFFQHPVPHRPGTKFLYNTAGSYILAAIVQKVTGQDLVDYLRPRLFEPLGIEQVSWDHSPEGICCGGFGIHLLAEDIAKLGLVYLNGGRWKDKQLLPEDWVRQAVSRQISNAPHPDPDWAQGYGYQIWQCRHGCFRFDGAYGQYMVAIPQKNALVVALSHTVQMQVFLDALWEHLLPAFDRRSAVDSCPELAPCPVPQYPGRCFTAEYACTENPWEIGSVSVRCYEDGGQIVLHTPEHAVCLPFGTDEWRRTQVIGCPICPDVLGVVTSPADHIVAAAGGWDGGTLQVTVRYCDTPHAIVWQLHTSSETLTFSGETRAFAENGGCAVPLHRR